MRQALDGSTTFLAWAEKMSGELLSRRPIDGVTEREIDLLVLMALHCSPGFRAFLVSKTAGPGVALDTSRIRYSWPT